ncbi:MAG: iron transporter [Sphaerochaeta sp.]
MVKKIIMLLLVLVLATGVVFANGTNEKAAPAGTAASDNAAAGDAAGFTEYPIFEDEEVGFINLSAVYFQPVPMSAGNENIEGFNIHLEADISALENKLGYGVGDWVPYLTVDYRVWNAKGTAAEGTFMVMSASDGPHYGANIALPKSDTYNVTITIHSPEENGYLLHIDAATGPGGTFDEYFANGNLSYTFEGWDYTVQEW